MRISRSIWLLAAATTAALIGCGSDFGGDPAGDASTPRDGARAETGVDGARQGDSSDGPPLDASGPLDTDGGARADSSVPPDNSAPPDGPPDARIGSGAGDARDVGADLMDARIDLSADTGGTDSGRDGAEGSPGGPDGAVGPTCGNGIKEPGEECDDGNTRDFDGCSWFCTDRRPCDCCVTAQQGSPLTCDDVEGDAEGGPKAGTPKAQLCRELYACVLKSRCGFENNINLDCYCGRDKSTGEGCSTDPPAGPCVAELEAGLEAEGATWQDRVKMVSSRMTDIAYGGGKMMQRWVFEHTACPDSCRLPAQWDPGICPNPDGRDAGPSGDAGIDTRVDSNTPETSFDISAPPDVSAPPDASTPDSGGVLPDGRVLTVDKDCSDCVLAAGQDPNACETLPGTAPAGPAAGTLKSVLCRETLDCIHQTNCHANALSECYCGTAIDLGTCNTTTSQATGACKGQLDRSLEVPPGSAGSVALDRLTDSATYAGGTAGIIATYEDTLWLGQTICRDVCIPYTPTQ